MDRTFEITVTRDESGNRIDKFLSEKDTGLTRSAVQKYIADGCIFVNSQPCDKNYKVKFNDTVSLILPEAKEISAVPQNIPVDIVYEDDDLLVVNKPKGMVVHPAPGNYDSTLVNALMYHCKGRLSSINGEIRPGIVHRIDKDTSGLLVVAKNDFTHNSLALQIKEHSVKRIYEAVVTGNVKNDSGTINVPLGRNPKDRKKQTVNGLNPRSAVTHYEVIKRYRGFTHCKFILETGRTHQIRVHCAYKGFPVAGDTVYGGEKNAFGLNGQCLHAGVLGFIHPVKNEYLEFTSELPAYFTDFINKLRARD